jgi:ketosteroid isomerase-like protein
MTLDTGACSCATTSFTPTARPRRLRALITLTALIAACATSRARPADQRVEIERATQHYASLLRGGPVDSVIAAYAENGELVIPGVGTLKGRKAIHDFLAPLAAAVTVSSAEMVVDSVSIDGATAEARGRYHQVAGPAGATPQEFTGGFAALWTRGSDGRWRLSRLTMQPNARGR